MGLSRRFSPCHDRYDMGGVIKRFLLFVALTSLVSWTCMASQVSMAQVSHQLTRHATSDLWSGYVAFASHHHKFTSVSAKWIEPAVTCPTDGSVAFWVGFSNQGTVEQAGSFIRCSAGQPTYWSFWEMAPTEPIRGVFQVQPGDVLKSRVSFLGSRAHPKFEMSVRDITSGQSSRRDAACGQGLECSRTAVDWIGETISGDLPNWGSIRFSSCRATLDTGQLGPIGSPYWSNIPIDLVYFPSEQQRAVVTDLRGTGAFFRDIWKSA
jgi:Peptidase A4 family